MENKYSKLFTYIKKNKKDDFTMTFADIEKHGGIPLDHSFLKLKKDLVNYGFEVKKISMKDKLVSFTKI